MSFQCRFQLTIFAINLMYINIYSKFLKCLVDAYYCCHFVALCKLIFNGVILLLFGALHISFLVVGESNDNLYFELINIDRLLLKVCKISYLNSVEHYAMQPYRYNCWFKRVPGNLQIEFCNAALQLIHFGFKLWIGLCQ